MSYCRFSNDNWRSDVYCYASAGGYEIHVAGTRVIGPVPEVPAFPTSMPDDAEAWAEEMAFTYNKQMEFIKTSERKPIGLDYDGKSFTCADLHEFLRALLALRNAGYNVPDGAISRVSNELAEEMAVPEFPGAAPLPIEDAVQYRAVMHTISQLISENPEADSESGQLLLTLANLAEEYEKKLYPHLEAKP